MTAPGKNGNVKIILVLIKLSTTAKQRLGYLIRKIMRTG